MPADADRHPYPAFDKLHELQRKEKHMAAKKSAVMEPKKREFVISRAFDAPRELVWNAWTDPERLKHWWGPKGFTVLSCKLDLRPGGVMHYCLRTPTGQDMWGKFVYREIVKPERLVFVSSFSDAQGGMTRHPGNPTWPLDTLSTVTFTENPGRTTLTVRWVPFNATEEERKTFESGHASMQQGWTGTLDQLTDYLATAMKI
jgi:uncharacterized protein YndB with AHSA1/START domain